MAELLVDDNVAARLTEIAEQENRPLDAVLRSMLDSYAKAVLPSDWPLIMARMADADTDIDWNEYAPDLSERSREILGNEFANHLLKRLQDNGDDPA